MLDSSSSGRRSEQPAFSKVYAEFYDTVYATKAYHREALRIHRTIQALRPGARDLVELGSGTGGHAFHLARWYRMRCFERSGPMLSIARRKLQGLPVRLVRADISRRRDFGRSNDAAVSLFHVLNYLTKPELERVARAVARSLAPGGVFILDSWNGTALLRHGPTSREKRYRLDSVEILRRVTPQLDWLSGYCTVTIAVVRLSDGRRRTLTTERHRMRYYLPSELREILEDAGFQVRRISNDDGGKLSLDDWSMRFVARVPE